MITYGSVCSGIESASVAWEPLGMRPSWFSEIESFPSAVLAHHWPQVPNLGDMTQLAAAIRSGVIDAPDVLVGGTPCQAFSVAGLREGLSDARGQLTITYVDILNAIDEQRPGNEAVCVWENVPGVLSSKDNAFGCFLAALVGEDLPLEPTGKKWPNAGLVYGPQRTAAWRIVDAQYFGVAQRRRRVFVVASSREGFNPSAVLFESEGMRRDTAPCREAKQTVATLTANGVGTCGADDNRAQAGHLVRGHRMKAFGDYADDETASTMKARDYKDATDLVTVVHGTQDPGVNVEFAHPVGRNHGGENVIAYPIHDKATRHAGKTGIGSANGLGVGKETDPCPTLTTGDKHAVALISDFLVRRLTPIECERLQGFPDNHTLIPWKNKPCPDGPRYKAIGNSKAVPVVRWLGGRLLMELL